MGDRNLYRSRRLVAATGRALDTVPLDDEEGANIKQYLQNNPLATSDTTNQ